MNNEQPPGSIDINLLKELISSEERQKINQLQDLVANHQNRVGTDTHLQNSVAKVIAGALNEAGVTGHQELSAAISPLVINVIRQEIRNSKDEIAQALYPQMGRLMSSYVSSNFYDFITGTNQKIERALSPKYIWLTLKSFLTGKPYEQLLLEDARCVRIREIMLLHKENGSVLEHWQSPDSKNADNYDTAMIGGLLTAINNFSQEVFSNDNNELRAMDLGNSRIYLRTSPLLIIAVYCTGHASGNIENKINQELQFFLEKISFQHYAHKVELAHHPEAVLPKLAENLTKSLYNEVMLLRAQRTPIFSIIFFCMLFLSISGWATTRYIEKQSRLSTQRNLEQVISRQDSFQGFPVKTRIDWEDNALRLSGLSPSEKQTEILVQQIKKLYPEMKIHTHLIPVFSDDLFQQKFSTMFSSDPDRKNPAASSVSRETQRERGFSTKPGNVPIKKKEQGTLKRNNSYPSDQREKKAEHSNEQQTGSPADPLSVFPQWPNFSLGENVDFNDPNIKKEMEKQKKFVVPERLKNRPLFPGLKGKDPTNPNGNSGNTGNSGTPGNANGQGPGSSNSNKSNAPGQLKKK